MERTSVNYANWFPSKENPWSWENYHTAALQKKEERQSRQQKAWDARLTELDMMLKVLCQRFSHCQGQSIIVLILDLEK